MAGALRRAEVGHALTTAIEFPQRHLCSKCSRALLQGRLCVTYNSLWPDRRRTAPALSVRHPPMACAHAAKLMYAGRV
jgi:hypothetical protein